ncbi:hypothetical protein ABK040_006525 [Willaertia magna]
MGNAQQQVGALINNIAKKDFPYEIEEQYSETFLWKLFKGKRRSDGEIVTIFKFDFDSNTPYDKIELAKASLKRLRGLRHPNVISFLDGIELTNTIYIVTEYVVPLQLEINTIRNQLSGLDYISWGFYQIVQVLTFLHGNNMYHCNINIESIFVDKSGDWKLGEVGFLSTFSNNMSMPSSGNNMMAEVNVKKFFNYVSPKHRSPEISSQLWNLVEGSPDKIDSYGLGCLIYEVFEGTFNYSDELKKGALKKTPNALRIPFEQLVDKNIKSRMSVSKLIENPYFNNAMVETQLFLENVTLKDPISIETFLNKLPELLPNLPKNNIKFKVLPNLMNLIKFGTTGQKAIIPIMKIGTLLNEIEYREVFVPKVLELFEIADRTIRVNLLKNIETIVNYLSNDQVEHFVYPNVSKGFRDTSPILREITVKSMIHIVPKLKEDTIDNNVIRFLWALQGDPEQAIRTNTIIAFGKLGSHLSEKTRKRILLPAFVRSLKDPFVHARLSALRSLIATKHYYSPSEMALRGLPFIVQLTVDKEKQVRDLAFQVLNEFLKVLSDLSEQPNFTEIIGNDPTNTTTGPNNNQNNRTNHENNNNTLNATTQVATEYFGWAVNSLKSKVMGGDSTTTVPEKQQINTSSLGNSYDTSSQTKVQSSTNYNTNSNTNNNYNNSNVGYKPPVATTLQPTKQMNTNDNSTKPTTTTLNTSTTKTKTATKPKKVDDYDDFFDFGTSDDNMSGNITSNNNNINNTNNSDDIFDNWDSWESSNPLDIPVLEPTKSSTNTTSTSTTKTSPNLNVKPNNTLQPSPLIPTRQSSSPGVKNQPLNLKKGNNTKNNNALDADDFFGTMETTTKPKTNVTTTKVNNNNNNINTNKKNNKQSDWTDDNWDDF